MVSLVDAGVTFAMNWSQQTFGPDGPWQAVEIKIGSQHTTVALYPGGIFASHILEASVCSNTTLGPYCPAQIAGLYDHKLSITINLGNVNGWPPDNDFTSGALQFDGLNASYVTDTWDIGSNMEPSLGMDMAIHPSIWATLPDGSLYPVSVGSLGLGAPGNAINQTFDRSPNPAFNATLLPGWLLKYAASNAIINSNSWGMHIGAAGVSPPISPSLIFGGFDQTRVMGQVQTQQGNPGMQNAIDLLDVSLKVISGASPWSFSTHDGLLSNSSSSAALPVSINSLTPYLHLPKGVCDSIAANLPVTYQPKYGLYFWNTQDPQYQKIVSSPSVLSFTFRATESGNKNLIITVPFKLLNLTLTAPLTNTPTQYFPCKAETKTNFHLGRAFLQAAFVGAN